MVAESATTDVIKLKILNYRLLCPSLSLYLSLCFLIESYLLMCFEGKWLQNRLRTDKNESKSLLVVDIQGHQRGGFCIVPSFTIDIMFINYQRRALDFKCFGKSLQMLAPTSCQRTHRSLNKDTQEPVTSCNTIAASN